MSAASSSRGLRPLLRSSQIQRRARLPPLPPFLIPSFSTRSQSTSTPKKRDKELYNYNTSLSFSEDPDPDHVHWRRVTARDLVNRKEPPTRVKMLVRDFIDDSLYNPNYGYFSRNATIFTPPKEGFDFGSFADTAAFQEAVADRYEKAYGLEPTTGQQGGLGRQVWHTPTELFKPYYAQSLITAVLHSYKLYHFPHQPLLLYEVGAGNGSFMIDSLTFLRDNHPDVFAQTKYRIIEISAALAKGQKQRAEEEGFGDKVEVINEDFFKWEGSGGGEEPCFVVALEVFDNFAHDMIRYDIATLTPMQAVVGIDASGDFSLLYEPITDPLIRRLLAYRRLLPPSPSTSPPLASPLLYSQIFRSAYSSLPFAPNLSPPDFIPTKAVLFLERLREKLPGHRLMVADFDELPDAVEGRNGPVVQTRYGGSMIPCETFLVKQGYFDIFFPTDFTLLRDIYSVIMNSPTQRSQSHHETIPPNPDTSPPSSSPSKPKSPPAIQPPLGKDFFSHSSGVKGFRRRSVSIYDHSEFLEKYGGKELCDKAKVKDGGNVMTGMYKNAKMMF
ncbi:hypothetical protein CI109_102471 [Kwoniella shandongensis]|uniref:Protein arginine methyltransferase NDUFAF7 n=1 Tax=Kwoniella shandongensis TaxID=1734106 RepID=A0A5M6C372_9TREE|nr:uncharacterized protein CI109_003210 [Kwoniella shandongensis]KAA5528312.1 hypothetical protein CI109_003210 [Kwoniella shandongensis]